MNNKQFIEPEKIIPALPLAPNLELSNKLKGKVSVIYSFCDSTDAGIIPDSTAGGWEVDDKI